jgi:uncharacterized protein (UPF0216 family)
MKLPFEFIRPIIESYIESYKNFSPNSSFTVVLNMRDSGFKFKHDYNVKLTCKLIAEMSSTVGFYSPASFGSYYKKEVTRIMHIPAEKSTISRLHNTKARNVTHTHISDERIKGDEDQAVKDKMKKYPISINGSITINGFYLHGKKREITISSTIEHEVLHFVQDLLAFDTWLFSKSDIHLRFFKYNMMTIGAYKSKMMKDYTKNQSFNFDGKKDDSSQIDHNLRPTELQTNLNSIVRRLQDQYLKEFLIKWKLKNKISNFDFSKLPTKKMNDLIAAINGNDNNSKVNWFKAFLGMGWRNVWGTDRITGKMDDRASILNMNRDTAVTPEIKKYFLKQLHKNFMEPMTREHIMYLLFAAIDPDPVPVPKRKVKKTRDPIDVPDPVPKIKVKKIIDPVPTPKLPEKKIIDPDKTKRKK